MKRKLEIMINHIIQKTGEECECPLCEKQESSTFLDGLRTALSLIKK